jgi:MFS family permease
MNGIISDSLGRVYTLKLMSFIILTCAALGIGVGYLTNMVVFKVIGISIFIGEEAILSAFVAMIMNESCTSNSKIRSLGICIFCIVFALGGAAVSGLTLLISDPDM